MNNLKCPHCQGNISIEVDTTSLQEFIIQERIEGIGTDGTPIPPTFLLGKPTTNINYRKNTLIRCVLCSRRFFEATREANVDEEKGIVILKHFSESNFKSWDPGIAVKEKNPNKFILKQRPKTICQHK